MIQIQHCLNRRSQHVLIYFLSREQEQDQNVNTPFRKNVLRIERVPTPCFFFFLLHWRIQQNSDRIIFNVYSAFHQATCGAGRVWDQWTRRNLESLYSTASERTRRELPLQTSFHYYIYTCIWFAAKMTIGGLKLPAIINNEVFVTCHGKY